MYLNRVLGNIPYVANVNKNFLISLIGLPVLAYGVFRLSSYRGMASRRLIPPEIPLSWNWTPNDIIGRANHLIEESTQFYDSLGQLENPSIDNLVKPFMHEENKLSVLINQIGFFQHVSDDKEVRAASIEAAEALQNFQIEVSLRHDLFLQFDAVWQEIKDERYEKGTQYFEVFKFVEKCHKDFIRAGQSLPEEKRKEVMKIQKKIALNSLRFSKNMGEQNDYISFTKDELDGVSKSVLDQLEKYTDNEGKEVYKVTFKYPDIFPVLKTAKLTDTRKRAFIADQNKTPENEELLLQTLKLRQKMAKLLGYPNYASYNLENKMAKKECTVFEFLDDLKEKLMPLAKKELQKLKQLKEKDFKSLSQPYNGEYYIWDHRYYDNMLLKENYQIDFEEISEYFPLVSSITRMLSIYEKLFKFKFVEETKSLHKKVWHKDVKQLAVWKMDDPSSPQFVGWIYFDLHPREGKYGHAANFSLSSSYIDENGKRCYPITVLVCNFSAPSSKRPSLLKHDELVTFFHELGHGIHQLVGNNRISRFNGPSYVPWDFVEAPSQMLEFWTWDKEVLLSISNHFETHEQLPEKLIDSLICAKHVNGALSVLRQLHFGFFDMKVHTCNDLEDLNLLKLWNESREEITSILNGGELTKGYDSFGHIMSSSYSAGYYGYLWSEVFATDMYYSKFLSHTADTNIGINYRDIVLATGSLYEINDNLQRFLGRAPTKDAFLTELGLKVKDI